MIAKAFGIVILIFVSCLLIYLGVKLLSAVWGWLLVIALISGTAIVLYRIHKNRPNW